jgi:fructose-1,6-bisphosphatase/inositol monophosphatase family enzyme
MNFSRGELEDLAEILAEAARAEILPRFRRLEAGDVRTKSGPLDLVTEADEAAERRITTALLARFPGCVVVGEEATAADETLLGRIADAELAFVVDPVDGTANFAAGLPLFGVMAAVVVRGEIVGAAIHDPMGDDVALALRGEGAWTLRPDGHVSDLRVAAPVDVARMAGGVNWRFLPEPARSRIMTRQDRVAGTFSYRCAAHEYRLLAGGHCHFLQYGKLMPWDHAPGWLLHREAGGYSARFDGSAYGVTTLSGGLICAPDRASWVALRAALLGDEHGG